MRETHAGQPPHRTTVSVVIPVLNEEACIGQVLAEIPAGLVDEVIVVDGGSTDATVPLARAAGARLVEELRPGYGYACAAGLAAAGGDVVVFLDGDGADDPAFLPQLTAPLFGNQADLVLGSRTVLGLTGDSMPWQQQFGNRLAAWLLRRLYHLPLTDLGTFRAARRQSLLALDLQAKTYGWPTETIVKAARAGWRIVEVPVRHRPRTGGQSKISGTLRGTLLAATHILSTILRYSFPRGDRS